MMQAYEDQWVSLGDLVYLNEDQAGTIGAEGFTDQQLCCYPGIEFEFGRECTFKLLPQQMYTMAKQLRAASAATTDADTLLQLHEEARREK